MQLEVNSPPLIGGLRFLVLGGARGLAAANTGSYRQQAHNYPDS